MVSEDVCFVVLASSTICGSRRVASTFSNAYLAPSKLLIMSGWTDLLSEDASDSMGQGVGLVPVLETVSKACELQGTSETVTAPAKAEKRKYAEPPQRPLSMPGCLEWTLRLRTACPEIVEFAGALEKMNYVIDTGCSGTNAPLVAMKAGVASKKSLLQVPYICPLKQKSTCSSLGRPSDQSRGVKCVATC